MAEPRLRDSGIAWGRNRKKRKWDAGGSTPSNKGMGVSWEVPRSEKSFVSRGAQQSERNPYFRENSEIRSRKRKKGTGERVLLGLLHQARGKGVHFNPSFSVQMSKRKTGQGLGVKKPSRGHHGRDRVDKGSKTATVFPGLHHIQNPKNAVRLGPRFVSWLNSPGEDTATGNGGWS